MAEGLAAKGGKVDQEVNAQQSVVDQLTLRVFLSRIGAFFTLYDEIKKEKLRGIVSTIHITGGELAVELFGASIYSKNIWISTSELQHSRNMKDFDILEFSAEVLRLKSRKNGEVIVFFTPHEESS